MTSSDPEGWHSRTPTADKARSYYSSRSTGLYISLFLETMLDTPVLDLSVSGTMADNKCLDVLPADCCLLSRKRMVPKPLLLSDQPLDLTVGDRKEASVPPTTPTTPSGSYKKSILRRYMYCKYAVIMLSLYICIAQWYFISSVIDEHAEIN